MEQIKANLTPDATALLSKMVQSLEAARNYARRADQVWASGYVSVRALACIVGIDSDDWTKAQPNTFFDERGIRRGSVDYELLFVPIRERLVGECFPNGGTIEEVAKVRELYRTSVWNGKRL
jgi:hypothetical protein